ncbi:hypothetical protein C1H46_045778 [Malus baccata]|uniref:Uncharacterized protein n=1 Tax=Malus baccata TaxID=106549 RepID=A0A540K349_MALBA|nr:hypothetical protein C1H46_045778 [Malus baccata]
MGMLLCLIDYVFNVNGEPNPSSRVSIDFPPRNAKSIATIKKERKLIKYDTKP